MFKVYYFLVLVLCFEQLESSRAEEYYQYVINEDAPLPCVPHKDCDKEKNEKFENLDVVYDEENENNHENFDEEILYDQELDIVPYDALNDALQELYVQRNLLKTRNARSTGNFYTGVEEAHRKYINGKIPQDKSLAKTSYSTSEYPIAGKNDWSDKSCREYDRNHIIESEFYSDGVTKNDVLERKKLELIRHTFANEKMKLLETDKFIHQIITNLGELENYEFDRKEDSDVFQGSFNDPTISENSNEDYQKPEDHHKNPSGKGDSELKKSYHIDYQKEVLLNEFNDFTDMKTPKQSSSDDSEEVNTDFDDFMPDELPNAFLESQEQEEVGEENIEEQEFLPERMNLSEEIVEDPKEEKEHNEDDKFVLSKNQYETYLRSFGKPSIDSENRLASDKENVYSIKTKTSRYSPIKSKRNTSKNLHHFEIPKFEDIPKVHELPNKDVEKLWNEYKKKFKKRYSTKSDAKKRQHWAANLHRIDRHNEEARKGLHTYSLKDNHLTDLHPRHYLKDMIKLTHSRIRRNMAKYQRNDSILIPDHFDWRDKGFVTPDWNQEDCGACYAFSITSAIQGQQFKKTSEMANLSIQQVVDCSIISGNLGCAGGSLRNTLNYIQLAGGLMKGEDYPYIGKQSICKFKKPAVAVDISSWNVLPPQDEHALKVTLATVGPLAVSINASPYTFQLYSSGIYNDDACTSDLVNHAMLLVGYTPNSWILKNWWSEHWGDKGYMYLRRGQNRCGVANYAVYALI